MRGTRALAALLLAAGCGPGTDGKPVAPPTAPEPPAPPPTRPPVVRMVAEVWAQPSIRGATQPRITNSFTCSALPTTRTRGMRKKP